MKKLFHGTTLENYENIIKTNFGGSPSVVWHCSSDRHVYFHDMEKYIENECVEEDEDYCVIEKAFESAMITGAFQNCKGSLVVLELEVEDENVEDDDSCPNMDGIASCVDIDDLDVSMIKRVYIDKTSYTPSIRLFVLASVYNNQYLDELELTRNEKNVLEMGHSTTGYYDWSEEFEYEIMKGE